MSTADVAKINPLKRKLDDAASDASPSKRQKLYDAINNEENTNEPMGEEKEASATMPEPKDGETSEISSTAPSSNPNSNETMNTANFPNNTKPENDPENDSNPSKAADIGLNDEVADESLVDAASESTKTKKRNRFTAESDSEPDEESENKESSEIHTKFVYGNTVQTLGQKIPEIEEEEASEDDEDEDDDLNGFVVADEDMDEDDETEMMNHRILRRNINNDNEDNDDFLDEFSLDSIAMCKDLYKYQTITSAMARRIKVMTAWTIREMEAEIIILSLKQKKWMKRILRIRLMKTMKEKILSIRVCTTFHFHLASFRRLCVFS